MCAAAAAGCGSSEGAPQAFAARVNSETISLAEAKAALQRGESIERLIDERLARQRALEQGLERAPQILEALESARREILVRAWRQLVADAQPRPTPQEIARYYAEHPELFAERRIYSLEQLTLERSGEVGAALRERAARGESLEAISRWLESLEVRFTASRGVRAAEQIPLELLPRLQMMKQGEVYAVADRAEGLVLLRMVAARLAPLDEAAASPLIEKYLLARRAAEALARETKRLRAAARIEYAEGLK